MTAFFFFFFFFPFPSSLFSSPPLSSFSFKNEPYRLVTPGTVGYLCPWTTCKLTGHWVFHRPQVGSSWLGVPWDFHWVARPSTGIEFKSVLTWWTTRPHLVIPWLTSYNSCTALRLCQWLRLMGSQQAAAGLGVPWAFADLPQAQSWRQSVLAPPMCPQAQHRQLPTIVCFVAPNR